MYLIYEKDRKSNARIGKMTLPSGEVNTPVFMPVGTLAAVKTLCPAEVKEIGAEIILANAYHLYLKPGGELFKKTNGLHKFMNWDRPILTDSGGFQIFSLSKTLKVSDEGVEFRSFIDGSKHFFTPETAMDIQAAINSDIAMVLDEPSSYPSNKNQAIKNLKRTVKWAKESKKASKEGQKVFGIIQGSTYEDLRKESIEQIVKIGFDGYAIGGFSVGEPLGVMYEMLEKITPLLPDDKPRYLMGVGDPISLVKCISYGVDMFDCVLPTRMARNGAVFTSTGKINIKNSRYKDDMDPLDNDCRCYCCQNFSRAYLRFIYLNKEILSHRLLTWHNLSYIINLVIKARESVIKGSINKLEGEIKEIY